MSFDIPITSNPSTSSPHPHHPPALSLEQEASFWEFLHTDELFQEFRRPSIPQPLVKETPKPVTPTLASFVASLNADTSNIASSSTTFDLSAIDFTAALSSFAATPADSTAATPRGLSLLSPDERPSGAKKLKQLGAAPAEIEEDNESRNTEASARFRAKKKEREGVLELRASELRSRVMTCADIVRGARGPSRRADSGQGVIGERKSVTQGDRHATHSGWREAEASRCRPAIARAYLDGGRESLQKQFRLHLHIVGNRAVLDCDALSRSSATHIRAGFVRYAATCPSFLLY